MKRADAIAKWLVKGINSTDCCDLSGIAEYISEDDIQSDRGRHNLVAITY